MLKNLLAFTATVGLVIAPVAAQANTRATSAGVAMAAMPQVVTDDDDDDDGWLWEEDSIHGRQFSRAWLIGLFGAAAVAIILLIESKGGVVIDEPVSPGT